MNKIEEGKNRLKKVLIEDKNAIHIVDVLKCDILNVLKNYMHITSEELNVEINVTNEGKFYLKIEAMVERLKNLNSITL